MTVRVRSIIEERDNGSTPKTKRGEVRLDEEEEEEEEEAEQERKG